MPRGFGLIDAALEYRVLGAGRVLVGAPAGRGSSYFGQSCFAVVLN